MGGSSAINGMVYIRGSKDDYDGWAAELHDDSWKYANVLPLFRRSEDNKNIQDEYHGVGGPIRVSTPPYQSEVTEAFLDSATQNGLAFNPDFNGERLAGVGRFQLTAYRDRRSSSADILEGERLRPTVLLRHQVLRILLSGTKANGVEVVDESGAVTAIYCEGAIALCAGAIETPLLLQRSGIGPADILRRAGIPITLDNPSVGSNLQDHLQVKVMYGTEDSNSINGMQSDILKTDCMPVQKRERLTVGAGVVGLFTGSEPDLPTPDTQFHLLPFSEAAPGQLHSTGGITLSVCSLRPESRGSVHVQSNNPAVRPIIDCSYLKVKSDIIPLRNGLRLLKRIVLGMGSSIASCLSDLPTEFASDQQLDDYIRITSSSIYHPAGSCAMSWQGGVVSSSLEVKGIQQLWIADASVMPSLVSGNTNAACMMIGERGAESIAVALGLS